MKKIPLYTYAYHQGIIRAECFPPAYQLARNTRKPDIIILHTLHARPFLIYRQILNARIRFGWRPLIYAYFSEIREDFRANWHNMDYIFSYAPSYGKNCQHEKYLSNSFYNLYLTDRMVKKKASLMFQPKTKFCNFVYSNHGDLDTKVRINFCQELMKYKPVDCPGKSLNNMPSILPYFTLHGAVIEGEIEDTHPSILPYLARHGAGIKAKLRFLASYKFTIAFENQSADYYTTEKIFHPFLVGSIPIYWGCPQIAEYFNPAAFINCHEYKSCAQVIDRIKEIDANPKLYAAYRHAPIVLPDSRLHKMHQDMHARHAELAEKVLVRRATTETPLLNWWWCAKMVLSNLDLTARETKRILRMLLRGTTTQNVAARIRCRRPAAAIRLKIGGKLTHR